MEVLIFKNKRLINMPDKQKEFLKKDGFSFDDVDDSTNVKKIRKNLELE